MPAEGKKCTSIKKQYISSKTQIVKDNLKKTSNYLSSFQNYLIVIYDNGLNKKHVFLFAVRLKL